MQQPKLLCPKLRRNEGDTGDVAARPVETGDEAELNRVAAGYEDDRDRRSRRLGYNCRGDVMRSDHRHLTAYQIGCEVGQSVVLVLRPAILDHDILALDVTGFTKALPECGQISCTMASAELLRNPITAAGRCCARAASGHAAAPPSNVMNERRLLTRSPRRRGRARLAAARCRAPWRSSG